MVHPEGGSTMDGFRRITVDEVRAAIETAGIALKQRICLDIDAGCACPIGAVAYLETDIASEDDPDSTPDAAEKLGLDDHYWNEFVHSFDYYPHPDGRPDRFAGDSRHMLEFAGATDGWACAAALLPRQATHQEPTS
jgi:hypothetical protein